MEGLQNRSEKDPKGWLVEPVDNKEVQYVDLMDRRGTWDSISAGRSMRKLHEQLKPGSRLVIVGRENPGQSSFIGLFNDLTQEMRTRRGAPADAEERHPGLAVTFSDTPTPQELQGFLAKNSPEAGYMRGWSHSGEVPYIALHSDKPWVVEFGIMKANSQTRTQATRPYHDGSHG